MPVNKIFKSFSLCGQCREGWWEGLTPSGWSGRCQEGSVSWAICAYSACFGRVFSQECLPSNWSGCGDCGEGLRDRQGWPDVRLRGWGTSWQGKLHFRETSALQKLFPLCSWALWMSAHLSGWPPVLIDSNSRLRGQGYLDREDDNLEIQVLGKSCSNSGDSRRWETISVGFYCLQVENRQLCTVTANLPVNC